MRRTTLTVATAVGGTDASHELRIPLAASAVFNATGRRVTDLPITLDKLL